MLHCSLNESVLESVLVEWRRDFPESGVLALLPEAEKDKLPLLQALCVRHRIPLAGGVFPALIVGEGFVTEGVWLLRLDRAVPSALVADLPSDATQGAARIADVVQKMLANKPSSGVEPMLYLFFDGMVPNIASLLDGLYERIGERVTYAGVNAGSETFQPMPCLFDQTRCIGNGVLCLLLSGDGVTMLDHGFTQPELTVCATLAEGNRIAKINARPAFDVYRELIKSQYGVDLTPENFYEYGVHFPLGIFEARRELVVRIPVALSDDGSLFCVGEVPKGATMVLMKSPELWGDAHVERVAAELTRENGSLKGRQLLVFYCAGRRMHLGADARYEIAALSARVGAAAFGGALSLGEIGSTRHDGYPMFHNATLVCTPWINA